MMPTAHKDKWPINTTAVLSSIAVVVVLSIAGLGPSLADEPRSQILAAELLVARDDLIRLRDGKNLPPAHVRGLRERVSGALGVLPWLLRQAGDGEEAAQLRALHPQSIMLNAPRLNLIAQLDRLIMRHPLDLSPYPGSRPTPKQRREARAIHDAYCAGCHDDAGQGDEDISLPARDLYLMARAGPPEVFLARLFNGVKGDETLLFTNPLTPEQMGALWGHYREDSPNP